jgi:tetratricopeptide (TPR) repeat protein
MEIEKVNQEVEDKKVKKTPKRFNIFQSILLLFLSFAITSGSGYALGKTFFWNDIDMKRVNEQLEFYKERVRVDPANLENRIILGYTYFLKGKNHDAIKEFNYVLDQDKNYFDAYYNLGLVYIDEKRWDDALSMFNKTVEIAPKDFKGHVQKGIAYRHLKMYEEAIVSLNEANKLNPANSDIIYQIGLVAEDQGKFREAIDIYKDALEYDPLFEDAVAALDRLKDHDIETEGEGK